MTDTNNVIYSETKSMGAEAHFVTPDEWVDVHLPDGRVIQGPRHSPIGRFFTPLEPEAKAPIVGAVVNGELRELTFPIELDVKAYPVTMAVADGARIYRRSLTFLLECAFEDLFPDVTLSIDHSVSSGGYYCQVIERAPLRQSEIDALQAHMLELVEANLPFERKLVPLEEAIAYFQKNRHFEKVRLLAYRKKDTLVLYQLREHRDYHHGYMVPSTGFLKVFGLSLMGEGFVLRYPRRHSPTQLLPMPAYPMLLTTFRQYGDWLSRLGIESVGALNDAIKADRIREVILVSEALHERQIAETAEKIAMNREQVRIILIAGPSSSGKTTFSKRLAVQLLAQGLSPFALEMDNYFVDRDKTPRDENGDFDYEALEALDVELLNKNLKQMIAGEKVQLPRYNFKTGQREEGEIVQLRPDHLLILEGIHGLNPRLLPDIPTEQTFRIYVSCLTQLNLDRQNRISTTDTRLIRRIIRDARERGYPAQQTIQSWESVRRGEKRHIFPYQENADVIFNSALVYEISIMRPLVEPLLRQVPYGTPEYIEAKRLLAFLEWFMEVDTDLIPDNSLLREFIGNSILRDFKVWQGE
ncbi:MAG TPA: nucleoside kinase [Anaerolineaceae bacterium]|nr:nucleoside kinase [Anaerolineaceae bacterium]